ncbi:MAG TPA: HlyC/CorC family transporter, partial [Bryobacteraceae bacterium]
MNAYVVLVTFVAGTALMLVTLVQLLYLESLRLRPRERPALEYFKTTLQARIGVDTEHGLLTFSLLKHTLLVMLGIACLLVSYGTPGGRVEACVAAWLTMLA